MSASPSAAAPIQSAKRPLEAPSSPSRDDQPEAKRPALDKIVKGEDDLELAPETLELPVVSSDPEGKTEVTNGAKAEVKDEQGDTVVPDAASHSIETSVTTTRDDTNRGSSLPHDESGWIHIRSVITSAEAATVIGKGGENVSQIRKMSGAKCTVSDYQKGAVERILTVSGVVDAVAKVRQLVVFAKFPS